MEGLLSSVLDQLCVLWGSGLTRENTNDLERTQKMLTKLVLQEECTSYNESLVNLGLQNLEDRRKSLTLAFAKRSLADGYFSDLFKKRKPSQTMKTRNRYYYEVAHDNTERFKNSAIIAMQRLQNEDRKQLCK